MTAGARFVDRLGLAIVAPKQALAIAGDRYNPGRSGSDLLAMVLLLVLATQLRGVFGSLWVGSAVDAGLGARSLVHVLATSVTVDLVLLVIAAVAIFAASSRREIGRAFDLACVAALPLIFVELAATLVVRLLDVSVPELAMRLLSSGSYAWAGALVALAIAGERRQVAVTTVPPRARAAGLATLVIAAAGFGVQVAWLVENSDLVRPVVSGEPAPMFALPVIGPGGALGATVSLPHGKIAVVDFWATWCGPCKAAMPALDAFARKHPEVEVLAINLDDPVAAREIFDRAGYSLLLVADDGDTSQRYGVSTIPHTVVIDSAGLVRRVAHSGADLEAAIAVAGSHATAAPPHGGAE